MFPQKHFIQRNIFRVAISDKRRFHGLADRISMCFRQDLRQAMEQIFDEHVPHTKTIQVRRLEIDLGYIPEDQLEAVLKEEFPRILEEKLLEILGGVTSFTSGPDITDALMTPPGVPGLTATPTTVNEQFTDLSALITYLNYGRFPVGFYLGEDEDLETLAQRVIDSSAEAFKDALQRVERRAYAARRIGHQFSEEAYWKIVGLLLPGAVYELQRMVVALSASLGQLKARVPLSTGTAPEDLREILMAHLIETAPLIYERQAVLHSIISRYTVDDQHTVLRPAIEELSAAATGLSCELLAEWKQYIDEPPQLLPETEEETFPDTREEVKEVLDTDVETSLETDETPAADSDSKLAPDQDEVVTDQPSEEDSEGELFQDQDRAADEARIRGLEDTTVQPPAEDLEIEDESPAVDQPETSKEAEREEKDLLEEPTGRHFDRETRDEMTPEEVAGDEVIRDEMIPEEGIAGEVLSQLSVDQQQAALQQITRPYTFLRDAFFVSLLGASPLPWWAVKQIDAVVPTTLPILLARYSDRFISDMRLFIRTVAREKKQQAFEVLTRQAEEPLLTKLIAALQPELPGYYKLLADFLQQLDQQAIDVEVPSSDRPYTLFLSLMVHHREMPTTTQEATWQVVVAMARISGASPTALITALLAQTDAMIHSGARRFSPVKHTLQALMQSPGQVEVPEPAALPGDVRKEVPVVTPVETLAEFVKGLYMVDVPAIYAKTEELWRHFLRHGSLPVGSESVSATEFRRRISELLEQKPQLVVSTLREHRRSLIRHPSIALLEEDIVWKLAEQVLPDAKGYTLLKEWTGLIAATRPETAGIPEALITQYILLTAMRTPPPADLSSYVAELITYLSKTLGKAALDLAQQLLQRATALARTEESKFMPLQRALEAHVQILASKKRKAAPETETLRIPWRTEELEELYVHNAGLVVLWPFLGHYFRQLEMLRADSQFNDEATALRAVHLLEYLATRRVATPEYALTLNKILCGVDLDIPTDKGIDMTERETQISESLLTAVIKQWQALKSTSPDGLRGGFLLREGALTKRVDEDWKLRVEQKPYDILLDKLPWGVNVIKLKWCPYLVHVEWR